MPAAGSVCEGGAVGAHLTGCCIHAVVALLSVLDALVASEAAIACSHGPSEGDEGISGFSGDAGLETKNAAWRKVGQIFTHGLR